MSKAMLIIFLFQVRWLERVPLSYRLELQGSDLTRMMFPHVGAYKVGTNPIKGYVTVARAHPRSFRAAYADYLAFFVSLQLARHLGDPVARHDRFLEQHPDELLSLVVANTLLSYYRAVGEEDARARQVERVHSVARALKLGISDDQSSRN